MSPAADYGLKSTPKLLTMDAIELTLLLKSIGFRLNSIDFNEHRFSGGKLSPMRNSDATGAATAATTSASPHANDGQNYINVEISCSKSKIVSNLSYKIGDDDLADVAAATAAFTTKNASTCTCPKRDAFDNNNSFWEIQSSGTFANQKRSLMKQSEKGIDNDTSSNLLPVLSEKSVSLTQVLSQVLLYQYKYDINLGETGLAKCSDIKSIIKAFEINNKVPIADKPTINGLPNVDGEDLNLITPLSSMNVTPIDPTENATAMIPPTAIQSNEPATEVEFNDRNAMLEETVNTEAFTSPKSDLVTSSPNNDEQMSAAQNIERDANIIHNLNQARHFIDATLLIMKLNVTRNISEDSSTLLTVTPRLLTENAVKVFNMPVIRGVRSSDTKNKPKIINPRIVAPSVPLRRSINALPISAKTQSATTLSRLNISTQSAIQQRPTISKISLVHRTVSGAGNRSVGGNLSLTGPNRTPINASANTSKARLLSVGVTSRRSTSSALNATGVTTTSASSSSLVRKTQTTSVRPNVQQQSKMPMPNKKPTN